MEWKVINDLLAKRRSYSDAKLASLADTLATSHKYCKDRACVYVTGSFARGEASQYSDLDVFIVGKVNENNDRELSRLNEIIVKADLISAVRGAGFPEFSGDGKFLVHHTSRELVKNLGKQDDDASNTFTARLLLLLESKPLIECAVYKAIIEDVLSKYWHDYEGKANNFIPAFFTNDILRLWRTFCVNYEANSGSDAEVEKAERSLKNYKLKHSRMLTCYSAILYLLYVYGMKDTVSPDDVFKMIEMSPTQRVECVSRHPGDGQSGIVDSADNVLAKYCEFLEFTAHPKEELVKIFCDRKEKRRLFDSSYEFGDQLFKLMRLIGTSKGECNRFYRLLVI